MILLSVLESRSRYPGLFRGSRWRKFIKNDSQESGAAPFENLNEPGARPFYEEPEPEQELVIQIKEPGARPF